MLQTCCYCHEDFNSPELNRFCCLEHEKLYWQQPEQLDISSECPICKKVFTRTIYTVNAAPYQALTNCPDCSSHGIQFNGIKW